MDPSAAVSKGGLEARAGCFNVGSRAERLERGTHAILEVVGEAVEEAVREIGRGALGVGAGGRISPFVPVEVRVAEDEDEDDLAAAGDAEKFVPDGRLEGVADAPWARGSET